VHTACDAITALKFSASAASQGTHRKIPQRCRDSGQIQRARCIDFLLRVEQPVDSVDLCTNSLRKKDLGKEELVLMPGGGTRSRCKADK